MKRMPLLEPLLASRASAPRCFHRACSARQASPVISRRNPFTARLINTRTTPPRMQSSNSRNESSIQRRSAHNGGTPPTTLAEHEKEVAQISKSVRSFYDRKEKFRIFHGSTNSTRKSAMGKDLKKVVDTSRLNHVVSVDTEKRTALVQPNVSMDRLVEETLKYGLVPPVVMEFVRTYCRPSTQTDTDPPCIARYHSRRRLCRNVRREQFFQAWLLQLHAELC